MRALIVGAGMAGLVTARQLGLAGWTVDVLEEAAAPRPDGYMMDFFGPGVQASERIGLYPRLADVAYHVQAAQYVDATGRVRSSIDYDRFARLAGGNVLSLLRPDLERACLAALDDVPDGSVRVHYGARVTAVSTDGTGARVETDDRRPFADADVVIGADGIHSRVRAEAFGPEAGFLRPLGLRAAAFIVHDPELSDRHHDRFLLTDTLHRTAGLYGLRGGEVATFLVYRADATAGTEDARERLRREFAGLDPNVDRLLERCPPHPYDDVVAQIVMPHWSTGRVGLVGDASGAVSLLAGQGGSLAIAGAALLADILSRATESSAVPHALAEFEQRWRPVVMTAQASGRRAAATFIPANRAQLLLRRWVIRSTRLPGFDRLVARAILRSIAK